MVVEAGSSKASAEE